MGGKDRQRCAQANKIQIGGEISVERRAGTGHGMINRVRCSSPAIREARAASVFDGLSLRRNFRSGSPCLVGSHRRSSSVD